MCFVIIFLIHRGRRVPLIALGGIVSSLAFFNLFNPPANTSITSITIWVVVFKLAMYMGHALYDVPYNALGAEQSGDFSERNTVFAYSNICAAIGMILGSSLLPLMHLATADDISSSNHQSVFGFFLFSTVIASVILILTLIAIFGLREPMLTFVGGTYIFVKFRYGVFSSYADNNNFGF
jgi:GPH family glycoside/pentoside/hexuronide:cation symporter